MYWSLILIGLYQSRNQSELNSNVNNWKRKIRSTIHEHYLSCLLSIYSKTNKILNLTGRQWSQFYLCFSFLFVGLPAIAHQSQKGFLVFYKSRIFPYITPFVFPIGMIAQSSSVYLTLCVTIERYVAVCSPLRARYIQGGRVKISQYLKRVCSAYR